MRNTALTLLLVLGLAAGLVSCADRMDPLGVTAHPDGWADPASDVFHGRVVLESVNKAEGCASCHGADYLGGGARVSCFGSGCHAVYPHPRGFADSQSGAFHAGFIAERSLWDLSTCRSCHGADYRGEGEPDKNCLSCHAGEDGPEACNTCHGSDQSVAPPPNLLGQTATTVRSVGAHEAHTGAKRFTTAMTPECAQCHVVPTALAEAGHLDGGPAQAEINFKLLATHRGRVTPVWDPATATCGTVYCHGAFTFRRDESDHPEAYVDDVMTGNDLLLRWTEVGTGQADCGTCHGLPPTGHVPAATCNGCHPRVVDAELNILDKGLHINGKIDVFGR